MHRLLIPLALTLSVSASARLLDRPTYIVPSSRVIGLYDSTDPGPNGSLSVLPDVARIVQKSGLAFETIDVSRGLPDPMAMRDVRGVVTAFTDAGMVAPARYLQWAEGQLEAGKRFLVLGNLGAYQDIDTKAWVDAGELNGVLRKLGVSFGGNWTDQVSLLEVVQQDSALVPGTVDLARSAHYQWFRITDPAVRAGLVIRRTDAQDSASAVVFTSPSGGMACERYFTDMEGKPLVALERLVGEALLRGTSRTPGRILAVMEPDYAFGRRMENNLGWIARYARLQVDYIDISDLRRLRREDLVAYSTVVLATDRAGDLPAGTARLLERWVAEDGGGLVSALPNFRTDWRELFGVKSVVDEDRALKSVKYEKGLYPGVDGSLVADVPGPGRQAEPISHVRPTTLVPTAQVLARGSDEPLPVLWSHRHGKGRAIFRNDQWLAEKESRGELLQLLLMSQPVAAAPIVNAGVYFLDDCPQPMWDVMKDPIKSEYGLSDTDFYRDVWWPDMKQFAKEFGLRYTFVLVFSYDGATAGGFTADPFFSDTSKGVPSLIAREAVALGHEVGLHGYNHQSLVTEKGVTSAGWPTREAMMDSLRLARSEWERLFGPNTVPFTYIAPNNHINRAGKEAVQAVFPETRVLATTYHDDEAVEGAEWDFDPDVPSLLGLPRVSSEFYVGPGNTAWFHDGLMLAGLWSHFVHPDDVFDPERNGRMGWKQLRIKQREMFQHIKDNYPWLRSLTARDAYHELLRFRTDPFQVTIEGEEVVFHVGAASTAARWAQLRVDPQQAAYSTPTATIRQAYPEHGLYIVELVGPEARVRLGAPAKVR